MRCWLSGSKVYRGLTLGTSADEALVVYTQLSASNSGSREWQRQGQAGAVVVGRFVVVGDAKGRSGRSVNKHTLQGKKID